ncbi:MAG: hypothetical protein R3275_04900 [Saprospiraceae bacterium]|nr:hypothetical protein [Saprospiraceae bacterium]
MSRKNANQNVVAALIVALLALAGLNIYQFINRNALVETNKQQESEIIEMDKAKTELEKEYYEALSELEEMKSNNEELNTLIEGQQEELTKQKNRISVLLKDSRNLIEAREEIEKLRQQGEQYLAEITVLREENEKLTASNTELKAVNTNLLTEVETTKERNERLRSTKDSLSVQNAELTSVKDDLTKRVNLASTIEVEDIDVAGYGLKDNERTWRKRNADKVDVIEICFDIMVNELAESGKEEFLIRVIDPIGETLAIERLGSGVALVGLDNQQVRYTKSITIEYKQEEDEICTEWKPSVDFREGLYTVEIYNKGFLAGIGEFKLR